MHCTVHFLVKSLWLAGAINRIDTCCNPNNYHKICAVVADKHFCVALEGLSLFHRALRLISINADVNVSFRVADSNFVLICNMKCRWNGIIESLNDWSRFLSFLIFVLCFFSVWQAVIWFDAGMTTVLCAALISSPCFSLLIIHFKRT